MRYVGNGVVNKVDPSGLWEIILPCYHLPDGTCIGFCLFDPKCNPPKPGPKPKPTPSPSPLPPGPCYRNPRPSDLPPGCFKIGTFTICRPEECAIHFSLRLGPVMRARCMDRCRLGKLFGWQPRQVHKCQYLCQQ